MGFLGGKGNIDFDIENSLNTAIAELDRCAKMGQEAEQKVSDIEKDLVVAKQSESESYAKLSDINSKIDELKRQLSNLQSQGNKAAAELDNKTQITVQVSSDLSTTNSQLNDLELAYSSAAQQVRKGVENWKEELSNYKKKTTSIKKVKKYGSPISIERLSCVGDLHGWAPGLINLAQNLEHKISIIGQELDSKAMNNRFPDPVKARRAGRNLPKVGLSGNPLRSNAEITPFFDIDFVSDKDTTSCMVLVGDMIDRGDHSELILEIMRQMQISMPGGLISLVGNHEVWLLEDDFDTWSSNEERYRMQGRARVGTTIYDPIITGYENLELSMKSSFRILQGSLGAYLLSQHFAIIEGLDDASKELFSKIYAPTFETLSHKESNVRKAVLNGGWELHEIGREIMLELLEESERSPLPIPGAYSLILIEDNLFCHAEINGICHEQVDLGGISEKLAWCGQNLSIKPVIIEGRKIIDSPLFYARLSEESVKFEESISRFNHLLPEARRYIHGHTVHSDNPVKISNGFEVINLDLGMTPFYRALRHDNPYNPTSMPYYHEINLV